MTKQEHVKNVLDNMHQKKDFAKAAHIMLLHEIHFSEFVQYTMKFNRYELAKLIDAVIKEKRES